MTLIAATLTTSFFVAPANAQRACQCTDYVASRFGISGYPNAGDWDNGYLQSRGFVRVKPAACGCFTAKSRAIAPPRECP